MIAGVDPSRGHWVLSIRRPRQLARTLMAQAVVEDFDVTPNVAIRRPASGLELGEFGVEGRPADLHPNAVERIAVRAVGGDEAEIFGPDGEIVRQVLLALHSVAWWTKESSGCCLRATATNNLRWSTRLRIS